MNTAAAGAIGSLDYPSNERKMYARMSREWKCTLCSEGKTLLDILPDASELNGKPTEQLPELPAEIQKLQQQQHPTPTTTTQQTDETQATAHNTVIDSNEAKIDTHNANGTDTQSTSRILPITTDTDTVTGGLRHRTAQVSHSDSASASTALHTATATSSATSANQSSSSAATTSSTTASLNAVTSPLPATTPTRHRDLSEQQYARLTVIITVLIILILLRKFLSSTLNGSNAFYFDVSLL
jgi:hypothetical protein